MSKLAKFISSIILLSGLSFTSVASELYMIRVKQAFPEAMSSLQSVIKKQGYKVSRVQRVDIGLTKSGFKTDKYRVVFFGKAEILHEIVDTHPELIPYLPHKLSIFAEGDETILVTANPLNIADYYPTNLKHYFVQWNKDINSILDNMKAGE